MSIVMWIIMIAAVAVVIGCCVSGVRAKKRQKETETEVVAQEQGRSVPANSTADDLDDDIH